MQEFLYCIQLTRVGILVDGPTEEEALIVRKHFSSLEKLTADGEVPSAVADTREKATLHRTFELLSVVLLSTFLATPAFGALKGDVNAPGKTQGNVNRPKSGAPKSGASGNPVPKNGGGKTGGDDSSRQKVQ